MSDTGFTNEGLAVRACRGHFHVTVGGCDLALPGDPYKTREAALDVALSEATTQLAALTAENERLRAVAEEVRTVRYTLMYVSSLLCEPVTDKNIRNARKAIEPLYYDALRDVKAERAALPSSRETTDG